MAEQLILDLIIQSDEATTSVTEMKKQIKELKSAMLNLDPNSDEFARAAKKAGELADNIDDASEAMNSMKGQGSLEGVNSSLSRMDDRIRNLDFDGLSKDINHMATSVSSINLKAFTDGIKSVGNSLAKLGTAILTNPIFILAAVITAVAVATYFLVKAVNEESDAERRHRLALEATTKAMNEGKNSTTETTVRLQSLLKVVNDHTLAEGERQVALNKMNGIMGTTLKLTDDITTATEKYIKTLVLQAQMDALIQSLASVRNEMANTTKIMEDAELGKFWKYAAELFPVIGEAAVATVEVNNVAKAVGDLKAQEEALTNQINVLMKVWLENEKVTNTNIDTNNKNAQSISTLNEKISETISLMDIIVNKPIQIISDGEIEKISLFGSEIENLNNIYTGFYANQIMNDEQSNQDKLTALQEFYAEGLILEEDYQNAKNAIRYNELENYKAVNQTMAGISSGLFEFLGNLAEGNAKKQKKIKKAAFAVNKATSAVETAINTFQSIMQISASTPPPLSFVLQALTGILGATQIAAILSKKFPENGEGGGASVSSPSATASAGAVSQVMPNNQTLFSSGGGTPSLITPFGSQQLTQKVYVLESDITSTQQSAKKVQVQSVI